MKKYKARLEREKKYIRNILTCHLGGEGKASRRVACERALSLDVKPICKMLLYNCYRGSKEK